MKYVLFSIISVVLCSCGNGKRMATTKARIANVKESQQEEAVQLQQINNLSVEKLQTQKIDSNIGLKVQMRLYKILKVQDSVAKETVDLESQIASKKTLASGTYKKAILPKLAALEGYTADKESRLKVFSMIQDGLDISNYTLFDLAAFFGPGKYIVPDDKVIFARKSFSPMVDSVILFSNKYSNIARTASLVVLGFADGTGFSPNSETYNTLVEKTGKPAATKEELNLKISELRAEELIKLLSIEFLKKNSSVVNIENLKIEYVGKGRGEEYPLKTISNYKVDDERRRVVLCYWSVLPD